MLTGCISPVAESAHLECQCPRGKTKSWLVSFTDGRGSWKFSGHNLSFYEERHLFYIVLPAKPDGVAKYDAANLQLFEYVGAGPSRLERLEGELALDPVRRTAMVSFSLDGKQFAGNGSYSYDSAR